MACIGPRLPKAGSTAADGTRTAAASKPIDNAAPPHFMADCYNKLHAAPRTFGLTDLVLNKCQLMR